MENEKLPTQSPAQGDSPPQSDSEEKLHRRQAAGRMGKFLAYTAPALIALATAKNACAN